MVVINTYQYLDVLLHQKLFYKQRPAPQKDLWIKSWRGWTRRLLLEDCLVIGY